MEVLVHVQSLFLISFQIFHVANKDSINTNSNNVRDDVEDEVRANNNNAYGNSGDWSCQTMKKGNYKCEKIESIITSSKGGDTSSEQFANKQNKVSQEVNYNKRERVSGD